MLNLQMEEQRLINERSLEYLCYAAISQVKPHARVRAEYSVDHGTYIHCPGNIITGDEVNLIEQKMQEMIDQNLPITPETWELSKAVAYFAAHDRQDKADLLNRTKPASLTVYGCNGYYDDLYGEIVPTTGEVSTFGLVGCLPGIVLQFPSPNAPDRPGRFNCKLQYMEVFKWTYHWCDLLKITNAADFYTTLDYQMMRLSIRVNEALMDEMIAYLADTIIASGKRLVMIAGPSSSGKTTFAARLAVHLIIRGHYATRLSLDDYYRNTADLPLEADGKPDFENLNALDLPLLQEHLRDLNDGKTVQIPRFNFKKHRREEERVPLKLESDQFLIAEGIHALNPALVDSSKAFRIFISALNCINVDDHTRIHTRDTRLLRRMVRDYKFRGTSPQDTLNMWNSVRAGEDKWIFPYQELADFVFNTSLHYELPVMKKFAFEALKACDQSNPSIHRLMGVLGSMPDIDDEILDEIPPMSLVREFVGGNTAEKIG